MKKILRGLLSIAIVSATILGGSRVEAQVVLNAWNTNGTSGTTPDGFQSTTTDVDMVTGELSRGSGINASALNNGFAANGWDAAALDANKYFEFFAEPQPGFEISLTSVQFNTRRSGTGPNALQLAYSLDGSSFSLVGAEISGYTNTTDGFAHPAIDLTGEAALQDVDGRVTFRLYGWAASGSGGTFSFGRTGPATNDLTIEGFIESTGASGDPEPSEHATALNCSEGTPAFSAIDLSWSDAAGAQLPAGYLLLWSDVSFGDIADPVDGTTVADGPNALNIAFGVEAATITGLNAETTYYFRLFPYSNTGSLIDYKTDGIVAETQCTTGEAPEAPCVLETFASMPPNSGSYQSFSFTGDNGFDYSATDARTDQTINGRAVLVRNGSLTSTGITGGIGSLTLTTQLKFTGSAGDLTVSINGAPVGVISYSADVETHSIFNINVVGTFDLEISTPGNGARVAMDDLQWTCYDGAGNGGSPLVDLHVLSNSDYQLNEWASSEAAGTYPASMKFFWSENPGDAAFDRFVEGTGDYDCGYDLTSRPRFNGLGADGFSLISTGGPQRNDCISGAADPDRFVGSAVLGLDMTSVSYARAEWIVRTVARNSREFELGLQYRVGNTGNYTDFGPMTTYIAEGTNDGDFTEYVFDLPASLYGEEEVYLRWVYYQTEGSAVTGPRPQIGVDNILITTSAVATINGCTDELACNYDPSANTDDGTCLFIGTSCDDGDTATIDDTVTGDCECVGTPVVIPNIIITELNYNPDNSAGFPDEAWEFLELYNADNFIVDLEGFSFDGINYVFPAGSEIAPGEYVIVARETGSYDGNGYQVFSPFISGALSNSGELVALFDQYGNTVSSVEYSDSAPWPTAPDGDGPSLELIDLSFDLNDPASWQASCAINGSPGAPNSVYPCPTAPLIISELHYDPSDNLGFTDADYEFVEIYNPGPDAVDLEGYTFSGINFEFPVGAAIAVGEYIIVAVNPASYEGNGYQVFGPNTGALSNSGESIVLIDNNGVFVDQVDYNTTAPWPTLPNGNGPSLELSDITLDNNDPANWQASCAINGTPGAPADTTPCPSTVTDIETVQSSTDVDGNSDFAGQYVTVSGIVTGVFESAGLYTIQDGTGAWSGLWVSGEGVVRGDDVTVTGIITEPFGLTVLNVLDLSVTSQENTLPAPEVLTTDAINQEQWEGVLIQTSGTVVNGDLGFGEFSFDDGSGLALVDNLGYEATPLVNGDVYQVTGPNYYSFSNFKLAPRDQDDVLKFGCTDDQALNFDADAGIDDGSCITELAELVINEIHYDPCMAQGPDADFEFFEIYNAGLVSLDLEGFTVSGSTNFVFPAGASIAASEYIIVAINAVSYTGNGYQVFQWTSGQLGNNGGTITISDAFGNVVDSVVYDDSAPWPTSPNGDCPSLELISLELDNSDPANWQASFVANGTPGAENSTPPPGVSYTIVEIQSDVDGSGGSVLVGDVVNTQGIVTGLFPGINYYTIQDGTGPWTGIWVEGEGVEIGDEVEIVGTVSEQFGLTRIVNVTSVDIQTQGNPLPAFQPLFTTDINQEQWEGVLLEITGIVTNGDAGFGEWLLNDGSGQGRVDNIGVDVVPVDEGVQFTVYGPLYYSFGNFKMAPRDLNDILRWGCTDDSFANFDPLAIINDGSCSNAEGCTDPIADNYDPDAVVDDGSCFIAGCTDPTALNYNEDADEDDGTCYFVLPNLVINEIHYDPCNFQGSDFDYEFIEIYNNDVMTVDLSGYQLTGSAQFTFPEGAEIAAGEYILLAVNAPFYEGNLYQVFEWTNGNLGNGSGNVTLSDAFGNVIGSVAYLSGAPWPEAAGGDCSSLELIDPSLDPSDPNNWQASYVLFGTPGAQNSQNVAGCTNPFACNYNAAASSDDGSCDFESCFGCTYEIATNYDPIASVDDGSCDFNFVNDCPADFNGDGLVNASDLGLFLSAFGTACP